MQVWLLLLLLMLLTLLLLSKRFTETHQTHLLPLFELSIANSSDRVSFASHP
jgi:hypothetical protein